MPDFTFPLLVTVTAPDWDSAVREIKLTEKGLAFDGLNVSVAFSTETDNDGQRVLYLHPEGTDNDWSPE